MRHEYLPLAGLVDQYLAYHKLQHHSPATIKHYQDTFRDWRRFLEATGQQAILGTITTENCRSFATWLMETPTKPWRGKTRRSVFGLHGRMRDLRAFVGWLYEENLVDWPIKVPLPKLPKEDFPIFTAEELQRIYQSALLTDDDRGAVRNRALLALLLDTGMWLAEIASLTLADLELDDYLAKVCGKGQKVRRVPYSVSTAVLLRSWLAERGLEPGTVFRLSYDGIRMVLKRIEKDCGVTNIHAHRFRHQAASMLAKSNTNLEYVRRILGHEQVTTTRLYLSASNQDLVEAHHQASPFETLQRMLPAPKIAPRRKKRPKLSEEIEIA